MSPLRSHYLKYKSINQHDTNGPICREYEETEIHFLLICPKYTILRDEFIPQQYTRQPCMFKFSLLMAGTNETVIVVVVDLA